MKFRLNAVLLAIIYVFTCIFCSCVADENAETYQEQTQSQESSENEDSQAQTKSTKPRFIEALYSSTDRLMIYGKGKDGSVICAGGDCEFAKTECIDGEFLFEVFIEGQEPSVYIYAQEEGKAPSDRVNIRVKGEYHQTNVFIGKDNTFHFLNTMNDFTSEYVFPEAHYVMLEETLNSIADNIHAVSPQTEIIYMVAPNHLTVYPETAPDWVKKGEGKTKLEKLEERVKDSTKFTFINPTQYLMSHKDQYRLYNKTDTHWNELGAYYAYELIMNEVEKKFPQVQTKGIEDYEITVQKVSGGDMVAYIGGNQARYYENCVFVRPKFETYSGIEKQYVVDYENTFFKDELEYSVPNKELPTLMMYRDSFSSNMIHFLAESFSESEFKEMWIYQPDYEEIAAKKPDYVVFLVVERSMDFLLEVQ